jgi:Lhr-like helicase
LNQLIEKEIFMCPYKEREMGNFIPYSINTRVPVKVVIAESHAKFSAFRFRRKTRIETAKDALDVAMKQYDGMSAFYDRFSSDENFEKLKRVYEFREDMRQKYEELLACEMQAIAA